MDISWSQLMKNAQTGDKLAYRTLLVAIIPYIENILRRKRMRNEDVKDVSQMILEKLHRGRATYDPARSFRSWLNAIIYNCINDHLSHCTKCRAYMTDKDIFELEVSGGLTYGIERKLFKRIVSILTDEQKIAFELVNLQGYSLIDAAPKAGLSISALKARLHRAYLSIKNELNEGY